ncbi:RNase H domain-containing protein [Trichonephila clavipes]|nr:RNase H domain-containing protein [Trichonephila clavipes]
MVVYGKTRRDPPYPVEYPTTENLLAFKKSKANARRVRRSQRQSWIRYVSSLTSLTSSEQLWKTVKSANGMYREFSFPILQTSNSVFTSPVEIGNILGETFQSVSSTASYNSRFLEIKRQAERTPINFSTRSFFPYNCDFTMTELKKALLQAHNTSPGPDGITYTMLRHLHWCAKIKDEVEKLAYQLSEEAERTERPILRLINVMYGITCADMQVDVMGECLSSIKHVVVVRSIFLAKRLHAV